MAGVILLLRSDDDASYSSVGLGSFSLLLVYDVGV